MSELDDDSDASNQPGLVVVVGCEYMAALGEVEYSIAAAAAAAAAAGPGGQGAPPSSAAACGAEGGAGGIALAERGGIGSAVTPPGPSESMLVPLAGAG